jgi:hypothetical protein
MTKSLIALCLFLTTAPNVLRADVLIVPDEFPAMEILAGKLKSEENIKSTLVWQTNLPPKLDQFEALVVYIHGALSEKAENAFIDYANAGGKLVLLHHSISSGKAKNKNWFSFLGISLPQKGVNEGGYKWIEPATWDIVNINPNHFITTNKVNWPKQITSQKGAAKPGFTLEHDEVYLNHTLGGSRTLLLGFKYTGKIEPEPEGAAPRKGRKSKVGTEPGAVPPESVGVTYEQDNAGWVKPAGKGWIIYLMPGHLAKDFEDPTFSRIVVNAVVWKP